MRGSVTEAPAVPETGFRPDIDGLRGLAILLVVLFHVGLPVLAGGFVGVDVFFVISGYLITGKLLDATAGGGRLQLGDFWGRRVRRLVPALAVLVVVVLGLSLLIVPVLALPSTAKDGAAASLYVSNLVFGAQSTSYFGAQQGESLFLHTWSLGVEEQFYIVMPIFLLAVVAIGRRVRADRLAVIVGLALATAASFGACVVLTARGTPWAFYGLPTRAWEFGVAGLLVCLVRAGVRVGSRAATPLVAVGLLAILGSAVAYGPRTPYPGTAALVPVLGTIAVILGGTRPGEPIAGRVLAAAPCQWLGRVSYSWYLWHWPLILLLVMAVGIESILVRSLGALIALGVALVALRWLENPVRFDPRLRRSLAKTYALGGAATLVALTCAGAVYVVGERRGEDPFYRRLAASTSQRLDEDGRAVVGCDPSSSRLAVAGCVVGQPDATRTVLVVGDSHAGHWLPALDAAGRDLGVRVVMRSRGGCPSVLLPIANSAGPLQTSAACDQFRRETQRLVDDLHPDAVVLSNAGYTGRVLADGAVPEVEVQEQLWSKALDAQIGSLAAGGVRVGVILDNPRITFDPVACISRNHGAAGCAVPRQDALELVGPFNARQREVIARQPGVELLDPEALICDGATCALEVGGEYVFSDKDHLAGGFTAAQAPTMADFLRRVLASGG